MWTQQLPNIHIRDYPAERCIFVGFHHGFHDEVVVQTCDTLTLRSTAAVGKLTKRVRPCDGPGVSALRLYHLWSLYHRFASCGPCTTASPPVDPAPPLRVAPPLRLLWPLHHRSTSHHRSASSREISGFQRQALLEASNSICSTLAWLSATLGRSISCPCANRT